MSLGPIESSSACARLCTRLPSPIPSSQIAWMTGSSAGKVWAWRRWGVRVKAARSSRARAMDVWVVFTLTGLVLEGEFDGDGGRRRIHMSRDRP